MRTYKRRTLTYRGVTKTLVAWADEYGLEYGVLKIRLDLGWCAERALTYPVIYKPRRITQSLKMKRVILNDSIESIVANSIKATIWNFKKWKYRKLKNDFEKNIPGYMHTHWLKVA